MMLRLGGQVFVVEFKMAESEDDSTAAFDAAMAQMRGRGYGKTYRADGKSVHLIGVACGREARDPLDIRAEPA